jgi:hypothetical protein
MPGLVVVATLRKSRIQGLYAREDAEAQRVHEGSFDDLVHGLLLVAGKRPPVRCKMVDGRSPDSTAIRR